MSLIDRAERLKKELTDKWVVVSDKAPELKRFANLTGKVKSVNMNCRALVEFDGPVDIGWYDIDPAFLKIVDGPRPKKAEGHGDAKPARAAAPAADAPAAKPAAGGGSPLDKIRAAGAGAAKPAAAAPAGGSPLDKIRASGAGAAKPAAPAGGGSPLDKIRAAGAGTSKPAAAPAEEAASEPAPPAPAAAVPAPAPTPAPTPTPAPAPLSGSPLDRIRAQGAAKR